MHLFHSDTMGDRVNNIVEAGGAQGGNFVQSSVYNPVLNIHTSGREKFSQHFQRIKRIGQGSFGDAWLVKAKNVTSVGSFIMKEIRCCDQDANAESQEIEILKQVSHENVVQYIQHFFEESNLLIVMELYDGGDLRQLIEKKKPNQHIKETIVIDFIKQITKGTAYLHSKKIIHRDLKPSNIFISSENRLKIGDFGISKKQNKTVSMAKSVVGTLIYTAPEVHGGIPYNEKADVWAVGCILYELASLQPAFSGHTFLQSIMQVFNQYKS